MQAQTALDHIKVEPQKVKYLNVSHTDNKKMINKLLKLSYKITKKREGKNALTNFMNCMMFFS